MDRVEANLQDLHSAARPFEWSAGEVVRLYTELRDALAAYMPYHGLKDGPGRQYIEGVGKTLAETLGNLAKLAGFEDEMAAGVRKWALGLLGIDQQAAAAVQQVVPSSGQHLSLSP